MSHPGHSKTVFGDVMQYFGYIRQVSLPYIFLHPVGCKSEDCDLFSTLDKTFVLPPASYWLYQCLPVRFQTLMFLWKVITLGSRSERLDLTLNNLVIQEEHIYFSRCCSSCVSVQHLRWCSERFVCQLHNMCFRIWQKESCFSLEINPRRCVFICCALGVFVQDFW